MPTSQRTVAKTVRSFAVRPDRIDLRDLAYQPRVSNLPASFPGQDFLQQQLLAYGQAGMVLDQAQSSACTGYALAAVVAFQRWRASGYTTLERVSPAMLYQLAQMYDEWDGEDYDGSSCRGAMKGWHKHGVCAEALWPHDPKKRATRPKDGWDSDAGQRTLGVYYRISKDNITDLQAAIVEAGAIYVSAEVHDGWEIGANTKTIAQLGELPEIKVKAKSLGGHAFAMVGYTPRGFVVQNSWGESWGWRGFAILPYEDWLANGSDAWVAGLGVPQLGTPVRGYISLPPGKASQTSYASHGIKRDPLAERGFAQLYSEDEAIRHSLLVGNNGQLLHKSIDCLDAADQFSRQTMAGLTQWLQSQPKGQRRVVIYAHGGLNNLQDGLNRTRVLAPWLMANGVYPLFVNWSSGAGESLYGLIEDTVKHREPGLASGWGDTAADAWDYTLEVALRLPVGALWREMKDNAARAAQRGGATWQLAKAMLPLKQQFPDMAVHAIGHSAGAIVLGHWLKALDTAAVPLSSCTLLAPACTVAFANTHYGSAQIARDKLFLHMLSDARERDDSVGQVYRKSLLYLVSRALESHKTPLLGMAGSLDPASLNASTSWIPAAHRKAVADWQDYFWDKAAPSGFAYNARGFKPNPAGMSPKGKVDDRLTLVHAEQISTTLRAEAPHAPIKQIASAHGAFDNDVDTLNAVLTRILGSAPAVRIDQADY
ncbi:C1 family peptidase [Chitinimonas sp. BJYL2]|uniref:C1 family peptidase n=1 Tax=Chitinimonas sp. BJYL2 TaxID=2976696 RepID=UPI0022B5DD3A|nr:C1 family peptidase [Chitinimonas sp. BJYL2]